MASVTDAQKALVGILKTDFTGLALGGQNVTVKVARGWPGLNAIQEAMKAKAVLVGVHDRGVSGLGASRPRDLGSVITAPGIASAVSNTHIMPGGQATLTVSLAQGSSAVKVNDACALVVGKWNDRRGAVGIAVTNDGLNEVAQKLLLDIQASDLASWLTVTRTNNVLTLTNLGSDILEIGSNCGNIGLLYREVGREASELQIVIWAPDEDRRDLVGDLVSPRLGQFRADFGYQIPSGEYIRVLGYKMFAPSDKDTVADAYRRDFVVSIDYSSYVTEKLYSVLVDKALPLTSF